jgi:hypothetical protein
MSTQRKENISPDLTRTKSPVENCNFAGSFSLISQKETSQNAILEKEDRMGEIEEDRNEVLKWRRANVDGMPLFPLYGLLF